MFWTGLSTENILKGFAVYKPQSSTASWGQSRHGCGGSLISIWTGCPTAFLCHILVRSPPLSLRGSAPLWAGVSSGFALEGYLGLVDVLLLSTFSFLCWHLGVLLAITLDFSKIFCTCSFKKGPLATFSPISGFIPGHLGVIISPILMVNSWMFNQEIHLFLVY